MKVASLLFAAVATLAWAALLVHELQVTQELTTYGHTFVEYWVFWGSSVFAIVATLGGMVACLKKNWIRSALALAVLSFSAALFIAAVEGASRAG